MRSPGGLWSRLRRPSLAGWGAAILLGPHLLLGTWLLVVPDHLAFTAAQVVTLTHVGLALVTFPLAAAWTLVHVRRMGAAPSQRAADRAGARRGTNAVLATAVILACLTGFAVIWGGDIIAPARLHAMCGVAVAVPLALHLWLASRRWAASAVMAALLLSTAGSAAARRWLPPLAAEAVVPSFAYATHDTALYEPAESCGECHVQDYADWKRSVHARTLEMQAVRESMMRSPGLLHESLAHIGQVLADRDSPISPELIPGACGSCHAPTAFYGDEKQDLLKPTGVAAEGTGCSFCHTLREVREERGTPLPAIDPRALRRTDIAALISKAPYFVSAPETVRRYLFQGSRSPLGRRVANWLIRWRPQIHTSDYHSPVLDDSRACLPCHSLGIDSPDVPHMTYYGWEHSPFNTGDARTTVQCQDCHMVQNMTGDPVSESARRVPWGPSHPGARSHLFVGGNEMAARHLNDEDLARRQHEMNLRAVSLAVSRVTRAADRLEVTVSVRSELVGHYFPALETQLRYAWVELQAQDAAGNVLARTDKPRDSLDFGCASPLIMASPDDPKPDNQRLVAPRTAREFQGHVEVPAGAVVSRVVAELHQFVDSKPIAVATWAAGTL